MLGKVGLISTLIKNNTVFFHDAMLHFYVLDFIIQIHCILVLPVLLPAVGACLFFIPVLLRNN